MTLKEDVRFVRIYQRLPGEVSELGGDLRLVDGSDDIHLLFPTQFSPISLLPKLGVSSSQKQR